MDDDDNRRGADQMGGKLFLLLRKCLQSLHNSSHTVWHGCLDHLRRRCCCCSVRRVFAVVPIEFRISYESSIFKKKTETDSIFPLPLIFTSRLHHHHLIESKRIRRCCCSTFAELHKNAGRKG